MWGCYYYWYYCVGWLFGFAQSLTSRSGSGVSRVLLKLIQTLSYQSSQRKIMVVCRMLFLYCLNSVVLMGVFF